MLSHSKDQTNENSARDTCSMNIVTNNNPIYNEMFEVIMACNNLLRENIDHGMTGHDNPANILFLISGAK